MYSMLEKVFSFFLSIFVHSALWCLCCFPSTHQIILISPFIIITKPQRLHASLSVNNSNCPFQPPPHRIH